MNKQDLCFITVQCEKIKRRSSFNFKKAIGKDGGWKDGVRLCRQVELGESSIAVKLNTKLKILPRGGR